MKDAGTLPDAFLDELRDAYNAEKQLLKALPKLARKATSGEFRTAFETHLDETHGAALTQGPERTRPDIRSRSPGVRIVVERATDPKGRGRGRRWTEGWAAHPSLTC